MSEVSQARPAPAVRRPRRGRRGYAGCWCRSWCPGSCTPSRGGGWCSPPAGRAALSWPRPSWPSCWRSGCPPRCCSGAAGGSAVWPPRRAVWLGVVWQLFVWTAGRRARAARSAVAGVPDPLRARAVALVVVGWTVADPGLGGVPGARPGAGPGAGGPRGGARRRAGRAAHRADHRHPSRPVPVAAMDRSGSPPRSTRWTRTCWPTPATSSTAASAARRHQVEPLGTATAREARVFITGNHEYYSGAREWTDYMASLGWTVLRNRHVVVRRGDGRAWWSPGSTTGPRRGRACRGTAPTWTPRSPEHRRTRRWCCWRTSRGRCSAPSAGSTCSCPVTPTAGSSGRSGTWSGWTSRRCRALPARPADPALHQPRHRLLGPALPDLRPTGDHRPDPAPGVA